METFRILCEAYKEDVFNSQFHEYNSMLKQAEHELTVGMMRTHIKNEIALKRGTKLQNALAASIASQKIELKKQQSILHNNGYLFITVNPKPEINLEAFRQFIAKISKKTCFEGSLYVLEQRGTMENNNLGKGFHAHILCSRNLNYKPTKCRTNVINSCKKMVGNIYNEHQLNIQIIGKEFAKDKKDYIIGIKTGSGKDEKQNADVVWRKHQNIEKFYEIGQKIIFS